MENPQFLENEIQKIYEKRPSSWFPRIEPRFVSHIIEGFSRTITNKRLISAVNIGRAILYHASATINSSSEWTENYSLPARINGIL